MCMKLPFENLNSGPYFPYSTNIYTRGMIITPRVHGDYHKFVKSLVTQLVLLVFQRESRVEIIFP